MMYKAYKVPPALVAEDRLKCQLSVAIFSCGEETDAHLFLQCSYSIWVLEQLLGPLGVHANFNQTWTSFLLDIDRLHDKVQKTIALLAIQIYTCHLWRERNTKAHDNGISRPSRLLQGIKMDLRARLASSTWIRPGSDY
ncbi:hypothetical protein POM88_041665 [Heracleum sosnowskyi]|uniref:Reverse transcriptase zinc-binding domain-containing protein n=1 Tax=Heracleum sosnowskyi TaxID=360622 RepID=A0AAD8HGU2_9APIA|nr:hypothetical protein POM88_041665 [Heracleum sosnowskyi]